MENKDNKILDELRRRGKIFEDPCPKSESFIGKLIDIFLKKDLVINLLEPFGKKLKHQIKITLSIKILSQI